MTTQLQGCLVLPPHTRPHPHFFFSEHLEHNRGDWFLPISNFDPREGVVYGHAPVVP